MHDERSANSREVAPARFQIGLRTALLLAMMASVLSCGILVHLTWWNTAAAVSRNLIESLAIQVADSARRAWWTRVQEVETLSASTREALRLAQSPAERQRVLDAAVAGSQSVSWLVLAPPAGEQQVTTAKGAAVPAPAPGLAWHGILRPGPIPAWLDLSHAATGTARAVAHVSLAGEDALAAVIDYERFARLLGEIPVGHTGRSFVLAPSGAVVFAAERGTPEPAGSALEAAALQAGRRIAQRTPEQLDIAERQRFVVNGERFAVSLSPLWFQGWQLAIVLPEADFLGGIDQMIARVALGLGVFVLVAGAAGAYLTRHAVAEPIRAIAGDLALVERFDLENVPRRRSRLTELDRLSDAIVRMSAGLADFAKFIPTDLVRSLLSDGMRAEPGGARCELTVLFADLAGFTRLSEKLGDEVVPIISAFLELASSAVAKENGTIDKFIGDAIMAFWGAPRPDGDQALHAARAALAIEAAVLALRLNDPRFAELHVRVGLQSGPAIVGNVGSKSRLNYTALGDTVNLASRLEGVNKIYGTTILVGPATAAAIRPQAVLREVDTVAVYGRAGGLTVFELVALNDPAGENARFGWIDAYERALAAYRRRDFAAALPDLAAVLAERPADGPALRLAEQCRLAIATPPAADWQPITALDVK